MHKYARNRTRASLGGNILRQPWGRAPGIAALALITACSTSPTGRNQLMLISPESAIVQSKQAYLSTMGELDKENKLVDDPLMADRVATITGRLVTEAVALYPHTADWEWSVAIIDEIRLMKGGGATCTLPAFVKAENTLPTMARTRRAIMVKINSTILSSLA